MLVKKEREAKGCDGELGQGLRTIDEWAVLTYHLQRNAPEEILSKWFLLGAWKSPVPPSCRAAGAVLMERARFSRQYWDLGQLSWEVCAAGRLWISRLQPEAGHSLCFLNFFLGVIGRYWCWSLEQPELSSGSWKRRVCCWFCFVFEI